MDMQTTTTSNKTTAIERALAAAKARKAAKASEDTGDLEKVEASEDGETQTTPTPKKAKDTDEAKAARKAERDAERAKRAEEKASKELAAAAAKAEKAAAREAAKAEKAAAKADKKPAHMKKVEKARAKLPPMAESMTALFDEVTTNYGAGSIEVFAQHILVQARALRTMRACQATQLPLGATVRITGGEPKFVGSVGKVVHSQKLRAKVEVSGVKNPVYIYTGEAEVVPSEAAAAE